MPKSGQKCTVQCHKTQFDGIQTNKKWRLATLNLYFHELKFVLQLNFMYFAVLYSFRPRKNFQK